MNLTVAAGLLNNTGIRIDTAISGAEALEKTRSAAYDLVLLDQRMPGMDGVETLRRIRRQEGGMNCETPVICMTADAVQGARDRYISEGFTDYLSKPIDFAVLEAMLRKYLPAEKVMIPEETASSAGGEAAAGPGDGRLAAAGIRTEDGLRFCRGDEELYRAVVEEFVQSAEEKAKNLEAYYDAADWKNYVILVHALKSSARTIGAQPLSEVAAALEKAAREEDAVTIRQSHGRMMDQYRRVTDALDQYLHGGPDADGEILEFIPGE